MRFAAFIAALGVANILFLGGLFAYALAKQAIRF